MGDGMICGAGCMTGCIGAIGDMGAGVAGISGGPSGIAGGGAEMVGCASRFWFHVLGAGGAE